MTDAIVITGGGAVTPLGRLPECWSRYRAGERAAGSVDGLGLEGLPESVRTRATRAERVTQLVLAAAGAALGAADLGSSEGLPRARLGVVLGTAFGCFLTNAAYARRIAEGGPGAASPRLFAATVSNAAAGELAIAYRLGGPLVTLTAGSAAGLVALGHAVDQLRAGRAEALVAGGADALGEELDEWMSSAGLDRSRSRSEAAAFVVLETAEGARRRGARIHASIEGYGLGFETPRAQPGADGLAAAIASALEEAGVAAGEVELCVLSSPVPAALDLGSRAARVALEDAFGATFAAGGPLGLLAALAEARRDATVLVVDACASGHVAALVARAGDAA